MPGLLTAREMREKRAQIANEAQEIIQNATAEGLSPEDRQKFDAIMGRVDEMGADIDRIERHEALEAEMAASRGTIAGAKAGGKQEDGTADERKAKHSEAFDLYLRHGLEGLNPEQRSILQATFQRDTESRAPQTVTTSGGGYLIPEGFSSQLEESLKAYGGVEQACDVFETGTGNPLPWPTVDDTGQTGALLAINTAAAEQAVAYGVVDFGAYKFSSKLVLVPVELMQDSAFDLNGHLAGVLGTRLGRVHNTYETTGTGTSQPQGIVTGASSGVTAASATAITYDELLDLEHSVDPAYRSKAFGAGYMFNDATLKKIRQLKDGEGRPLWQPGITGGAPDTINGYGYTINQDMASIATGTKPILFGALKKFKVRKVKGFTLLRLVERYAEFHQVGFLAFTRMDSRMLDAGTDPVKFITMA